MIEFKLEEVVSVKNYAHIDIFIFNLPLQIGFCKAKFKLIVTPGFVGLEFRIANGWPRVFVNWPGQTQDAYGQKFILAVGEGLLGELRRLGAADLEFLRCLVDALPQIIETALRESGSPMDVSLPFIAATDTFHEEFRTTVAQLGHRQGSSTGEVGGNPAAAQARLVDTLICAQIEAARRLHGTAGPSAAGSSANRADPPNLWVELGLAGTFLAYQHDADRAAVTSVVVGDAIRLGFPSVSGWLRLLSAVDRSGPLVCRLLSLVEVHIRATAAPAMAAAIGIGLFDCNGRFCVVHTFCHNCSLPDGTGSLTFTVSRAALKRSLGDVEVARQLFLFVEFDAPAEIEFVPPSYLEADPAGAAIPYRNSEQAACERLVTLNAQLQFHIKMPDRLRWLIGEAELAYRFECLQTASALARQIVPHCQELEPGQRRRFLSLWVELGFAEDRQGDVCDLLLVNFALATIDDHLFTALSLCLPPGQAGEMFDRLPSGKPNRAYLSRESAPAKALGLLAEATLEGADGQSQLLAASLLRIASPQLYLKALNDFLARHDLAPLAAASAGGLNVLASFRFVALPRLPAGPKVSVIMAAYNTAETVSYSINSILEQSHQEIELLVCDDCSTDTTAEEIARWRHDDRVRIFRSVGNQGPYNIRNCLIAEASGAYITFQDADDVSHPERLHRQVQVLENGSAAAVFGQWIRIRPDGAIVFFRDHRCMRMCVASFMARRQLFREHGGYRTVLCGADTDFLERVRLERGPEAVIAMELPLVFGLWSARSLTRQPGLEATEHGFRSASRRRFAEIAGRQRLLGRAIVPDCVVDAVVQEAGIHRPCQGVVADLTPARR